MRYLIVSKYYVRRERLDDFVAAYKADGARAQLFRRADGYLWTSLVRSAKEPCAYVTMDVWRSHDDYINFQSVNAEAAARFNATCVGYTEEEVPVYAGEALPGK